MAKVHPIIIYVCCFCVLQLFAVRHAEAQDVVVTINPLHGLVSGVMGDTGRAVLLLSPSISPHGVQLKPSQLAMLRKAKVIFYVDDSIETFMPRVRGILPADTRVVALGREAGVPLLPYRSGGLWRSAREDDHDDHDHDDHDHDEHHDDHDHDKHHDDHDHDDHESHHHHGGDDMHVWLDPKNAIVMARAIESVLSEINPSNKQAYQAQTERVEAELTALDEELRDTLSSVADEPFIVFHDAYQYFERAYGLAGLGSMTLEPHTYPSPQRIKQLRDALRKTKARCVFSEPQFPTDLVRVVTEGIEARVASLSPLGHNTPSDKAHTLDAYTSTLKNLAKAVYTCLEG